MSNLLAVDKGDAHYRELGVDPAASVAEIRRAYLRLARESHPDFHTDSDGSRHAAEERMRRIRAEFAATSLETKSAIGSGSNLRRSGPDGRVASGSASSEPKARRRSPNLYGIRA